MSFRSPKLLKSANGQPCVLCGATGSTVAAHANSVALGKGTGIKAPDFYTAFVCGHHHSLIDGREGRLSKEEKQELWMSAYLKTVALWFDSHIVVVK
jgi:hypothetical protein